MKRLLLVMLLVVACSPQPELTREAVKWSLRCHELHMATQSQCEDWSIERQQRGQFDD